MLCVAHWGASTKSDPQKFAGKYTFRDSKVTLLDCGALVAHDIFGIAEVGSSVVNYATQTSAI